MVPGTLALSLWYRRVAEIAQLDGAHEQLRDVAAGVGFYEKLLRLAQTHSDADNKQRAFMSTLAYSFLEQTLAGKNRGE